MDHDFAFSNFLTLAEWETAQQEREVFNEKFNRDWEERQERIARGKQVEIIDLPLRFEIRASADPIR